MAAMLPKHVAKNHEVVALNIVSFINVVYDVKMLIMSHNGMASIKSKHVVILDYYNQELGIYGLYLYCCI